MMNNGITRLIDLSNKGVCCFKKIWSKYGEIYSVTISFVRKDVYMKNIKFADCGLDVSKNLFVVPTHECDEKCVVLLKDKQAVVDFGMTMCNENDCQQCGVFAVMNDGRIMMAFVTQDRESADCYELAGDIISIGQLAKSFELHCYGLIVEGKNGEFTIIEK